MTPSLVELLRLTRPFIIFDYETTGRDPDIARAVSLAMKVHKPDGSLTVYKTLIDPEMEIPEASIEVHGITNEMIQSGCAKCWAPAVLHPFEKNGSICREWRPVPTFKVLAEKLHHGFVDADFSGYNIRYDLKVSVAEFKRCGLDFDYTKAYIVEPFSLWRVLEPRSLENAVERFMGRKHIGAHDAMADVEEAEAVLLNQLLGICHQVEPRWELIRGLSLQQLHDLCFPPEEFDPDAIDRSMYNGRPSPKFKFINGEACFAFGKPEVKGQPIRKHHGYLRWMIKSDFTEEVKQICKDALVGKYPVPGAQKDVTENRDVQMREDSHAEHERPVPDVSGQIRDTM